MNENIAKIREVLGSKHTLADAVALAKTYTGGFEQEYLKDHITIEVLDRSGDDEKSKFPKYTHQLLYNGNHQCFLNQKESEEFCINALEIIHNPLIENWPTWKCEINPCQEIDILKSFFIREADLIKLGF